jgi:hypothetical protein
VDEPRGSTAYVEAMISSGWAVASVLGATLVSVALSPDSAASPNGAAPTDQRRQAIVSAFATAFVHDDHAGINANATPDSYGRSLAPASCPAG